MSSDPIHERYWPRDAQVRWMALGRNLAKWTVSIASAVAHLALAVIYVAAITSETLRGAAAWLLAVGWTVLAFYLVWNWWFFRWRIALAPVGAALLLWQLGGWPRG
jgi:hypothetical protein